jgi:hypothetical protein
MQIARILAIAITVLGVTLAISRPVWAPTLQCSAFPELPICQDSQGDDDEQ